MRTETILSAKSFVNPVLCLLRDVVCYTCSIADNKSPITASKMTLKKTTVVKLLNLLFWLRVHPCNQYMYIQDTFTLHYPLQYTLVLKNSPCYTSLHFQLLGGWKSKLGPKAHRNLWFSTTAIFFGGFCCTVEIGDDLAEGWLMYLLWHTV